MKVSIYNLYIPYEKNIFLIYNTLTSAILKVDEDVVKALSARDLQKIPANLLEILGSNGILVEDEMDETLQYKYFFDHHRYNFSMLDFIFIPTFACNLRCTYCVQGLEKDPYVMKKSDVTPVVEWVSNAIKNSSNCKEVQITLYGGEPLLAEEQCINFMSGIKNTIDDRGARLVSHIITNATLIDQNVIDELIIPYNFHLQITLDGPKEVHDKRRIRANGKGTYDRILKSLDLLDKNNWLDHVQIRINLDRSNYLYASELIKDLNDSYPDIYRFVYGFVSRIKPKCREYETLKFSEFMTLPLVEEAIESIKDKGPIGRGIGKLPGCTFVTTNMYSIDPYGNIYKCGTAAEVLALRIGTITEDRTLKLTPEFYKQMNRNPFALGCGSCKLLPVCGGGCPMEAYLKNGTYNSVVCSLSEDDVKLAITDYIKHLDKEHISK